MFPSRLFVILGLIASASACRAPELRDTPYAFLAEGRTGLVWKQPVANKHRLEGDFDIGPVPDPLGGPDNFFEEADDGKVVGKYEVALAARSFLGYDTTLEAGIGYRQFDIEGLNPVPDPAMEFSVETVDSLQFYLALRHFFEMPGLFDGLLSERWRWFAEVGFFLAPGVDVEAELHFLTTTQPLESKADAYYFLTATGGLSYQLSDEMLVEIGVSWEELLNPLQVDLSSTVDFGGGQVITIPIEAEMTPEGGIAFFALTWYP